jgi:hypothetical protein
MVVDEQFRRSVVFLCRDDFAATQEPRRIPVSTAFLVSIPSGPERVFVYVVTAGHVIDGLVARGVTQLYVRIPHRNGGAEDSPISPDAWIRHPSSDVAVAQVTRNLPSTVYDVRWIPTSMFVTETAAHLWKVSIGDEVFFPGLLVTASGYNAAEPIVRFGTIALGRSKVPTRMGDMDAYLVEARSWGGHSGSPTFVYLPPRGPRPVRAIPTQDVALLGLVHGHFDVELPLEGDCLDVGRESTASPTNAGIAVIVSAQGIVEVLHSPRATALRREPASSGFGSGTSASDR